MTKLYFVRHGLTKNNALAAFNGSRSNHFLLPEGQQQAKQLGRYLHQTKFKKVYASPQNRALETASLIMHENQLFEQEIIQDKCLQEIDFGEWDGVPIAEKMQEEQYDNLKYFPEKYDPSQFGGESYLEVKQRGEYFLSQLDYSTDDNYLVVSHGVLLLTLLQTINKKGIHQIREEGLLDNASLTVVETTDGQEFQRLLWNFTDYV